jgi:hypothetical protein
MIKVNFEIIFEFFLCFRIEWQMSTAHITIIKNLKLAMLPKVFIKLNRITLLSAHGVNRIRFFSILLLLINGIAAIAAGHSFIADPSGAGIGMTTDYLVHSPFSDFFIPGIILYIMNGILSIVVAIMVLIESRYYPFLIVLQGAVLSGWIIIQLAMLRFFHPLHLIMGIIGMLLIFMGCILSRSQGNKLF